jgi:predicted transcriptional regulator
MKPISNDLIEPLKTLGLTEYEAKVYAALVHFEKAEARQIYEYLDAPKPGVYQSLKTLTEKGLAQVVNAKPAIYRAVPPRIALKHMMEMHREAEAQALRELEKMDKDRLTPKLPDILWTLYGERSIENSLEEVLGATKKSVRVLLSNEMLDHLGTLRGRDAAVDLIVFGSDPSVPARYGLKRARMHDLTGIDTADLAPFLGYLPDWFPPEDISRLILILRDSEEFLYIPPLPASVPSGLTSRNPFIIALGNMMFSIIWDRTPPVALP